MKLFITIFILVPTVTFAANNDLQLHLECQKGDECQQFEGESGPILLRKEPEMVWNEENVLSADINTDAYGGLELSIHMNAESTQKFTEATEKAIGGTLAIVVGNKVVSNPSVREKIVSEHVRISAGVKRTLFWEDIPWIKEKAAQKRNSIGEANNKSLMIYGSIGAALLLTAVWFVFGRRKA
jgi:hypothetical protein